MTDFVEPYSAVFDYVDGDAYLSVRPEHRHHFWEYENQTRLYMDTAATYMVMITWNGTAAIEIQVHDGGQNFRAAGEIPAGTAWIPRSTSIIVPTPPSGPAQVRLRNRGQTGAYMFRATALVMPSPAPNGGGGRLLGLTLLLVVRWVQ